MNKLLKPTFDVLNTGHFSCFGQSGSGKTVYIKHVLSTIGIVRANIHVFTPTVTEWSGVSDNIHESFDDVGEVVSGAMTKWRQGKKIENKTAVIMDDYSAMLDVNHDERYSSLFTRGRHCGIVVFALGQTPTLTGRVARQQSKYVVLLHTSDVSVVSQLSQWFLFNDTQKLINALDKKPSKYTAIIIETETRKIMFDQAPDPKGDRKQTMEESVSDNKINGGGVNNQIGSSSKSYSNSIDQSKTMNNYNINQNVEIQNLITQNNIKNQLAIQNMKHQQRMTLMAQKEECKNLILTFPKSWVTKTRLATLLNIFCQMTSINAYNYHKYARAFMRNYFPSVKYNSALRDNWVADNVLDVVNSNYRDMAINHGVQLLTNWQNRKGGSSSMSNVFNSTGTPYNLPYSSRENKMLGYR